MSVIIAECKYNGALSRFNAADAAMKEYLKAGDIFSNEYLDLRYQRSAASDKLDLLTATLNRVRRDLSTDLPESEADYVRACDAQHAANAPFRLEGEL